jgi:PAS domain S-box-containing protein
MSDRHGVLEDATPTADERCRLEESERDARLRLDRAFAALGEAVFVVDTRSRVIVDCNQAVERIFGYPRNEVLGRNTEFLHVDREMYERFGRELFAALDASGIFNTRFEMKRRDGSLFVSDHTVTEVRDERGERVIVVSVVRDVTERHLAEQQVLAGRELLLAFSEARDLQPVLRHCLETAIRLSGMECGGIYLIDEDGGLRLAHSSGISPEFVAAASYYPADSRNTRLVMEGKPVYGRHRELGLRLSGPEPREGLQALAVVPLSSQGRVIGCVNVASSVMCEAPHSGRAALEATASLIGLIITRAQADAALQESEERYRTLFERVPDCVALFDAASGTLVEGNTLASTMLGYTREELRGLTIEDIEAVESPEQITSHIRKVLQHGSDVFETRHRRSDGALRDVRVSVSTVELDGKPHLLSIWTDITDRVTAENALRQQQEMLARAERVARVSAIASSLAHELNQPLTAILSSAQAARRLLGGRPPDLEEVRRALDDLVDDGRRAAQIVASLREMVRRGSPARRPADINEVVRDTLRLCRPVAPEGEARVRTRLGRAVPHVLMDPVQIQQVVSNLVANARQATAGASPETAGIGVETAYRPGTGVVVAVSDRGPGVPAGDLDRVFEAFYTTRPDGLGLGLAICRSIVEAHGGKIWAERRRGGGARVCFVLPATADADG